MQTYRISCVLICLVTVLLGTRPADAQTNSAATFSSPVQLPGVLLPAGSYAFAVTLDGRSVVVSDAAHRVVAKLEVAPITRAAVGEVITMRSAVGTAAPEISALYTSGGKNGVEFLYDRVRK
jgi:hypothetical protein